MHPADSLPLVTLGMPVYNESKYLRETLENLIQQTYPNLEILLSDNASTDGTSEICAEYAAKYPHVTHVRHQENMGQHANFNYLPCHAHGIYFCWVSGHDLLDSTFVKESVKVLESDFNIVLAYPRTMNMQKDGTYTREKVRPFDIRAMSPAERFREVMWRVDCNYVYGVFRLRPMLESKLFQSIPVLDRVFLAEMAVKGTFAPVDTFKYYRMTRATVQTEIEKRHRIMNYIHPGRTFTDVEIAGNDFHLPTRRAFLQIVREGSFPWHTRMHLFLSVWLCGVMKFHLFPGADILSLLAKKLLPAPVLKRLLKRMQ